MIITEYGTQKCVCDSCDSNEHLIADDFNDEIAQMKEDGWKITRPEGQWHHECPRCVQAGSRLAQQKRLFGIK